MNLTLGPLGCGGASHASKSSKSRSSRVTSSAMSSSSVGTGIEGLAGGGVLSICWVGGISIVSISISLTLENSDSFINLGNTTKTKINSIIPENPAPLTITGYFF